MQPLTHIQQVLQYLKQGHKVLPPDPQNMVQPQPFNPMRLGNMPASAPPNLNSGNYVDKYDIMDNHRAGSWRNWPVTGGQ